MLFSSLISGDPVEGAEFGLYQFYPIYEIGGIFENHQPPASV